MLRTRRRHYPLFPYKTLFRSPLLGPDFHRLDRTSFAWRTHSMTSSARASNVGGNVKPDRLGRLQVDDEFEFSEQLDRHFGWFVPLENATSIAAELAIGGRRPTA